MLSPHSSIKQGRNKEEEDEEEIFGSCTQVCI
jgi:hypothetical protein